MFNYARRIFFTCSLLITSTNGWTGVMEADLFTAGDGLLTVDDQSGYEWLDLTETWGSSINEARASTFVTQLGFRVADVFEVSALYESAGLIEGFLDPFSEERQSISSTDLEGLCLLICGVDTAVRNLYKMGTGPEILLPFQVPSSTGRFLALEHLGVGLGDAYINSFRFFPTTYEIRYDPLDEDFDYDTRDFYSGVFLVRGEVPVPTPLSLIAMGVIIISASRRKHLFPRSAWLE
jgi:hypothetical protein